MSDDAVLSCLDRRQTGSTVQLNPCMSFLTTRYAVGKLQFSTRTTKLGRSSRPN